MTRPSPFKELIVSLKPFISSVPTLVTWTREAAGTALSIPNCKVPAMTAVTPE
jgi:hypothetical protein